MIQLTANYDDLSTDRGSRFGFSCDTRHNGHTSTFETSVPGAAKLCSECGVKMPTWQ